MPAKFSDRTEAAQEASEADALSHGRTVVAIVVPTYNEAENLPELARRIFALEMPSPMLIVVDDGSPDGTGQVAEALQRQYRGRVELIQRGRKLGLGTAYVEGFSRAMKVGADYIVQMDADLSHAPEYLPEFLDRLKDADVVVGSRYVAGGEVDESWDPLRRLLSFGGNLGIRFVSGLRTRDATSGFKAFRRSVLGSVDFTQLHSRGFAFQTEMAHACQRGGYKVVEHPIVFARRAGGRSKMSAHIVFEALWRLLPLRLKGRW